MLPDEGAAFSWGQGLARTVHARLSHFQEPTDLLFQSDHPGHVGAGRCPRPLPGPDVVRPFHGNDSRVHGLTGVFI